MRFLSIYKAPEPSAPPSPEHMAAMEALIARFTESGHLIATEGCLPTSLGARVRREQGKDIVVDGPFTEAKEVVGGFALLQADSKEEAIRLVKEFLDVVGEGECELRQVYEAPVTAS